jgi:prepilin-type N-terminal cleavage/methylation domain-containing protein
VKPRATTNRRAVLRRRGFTLLEMMLASVLGAAVVLASFSLMAAMTSTDDRTKERNKASAELSRAHQAFRKAFGSVVVKAAQPRTINRNASAGAVADPKSGVVDPSKPEGSKIENPEDQSPPRVLLENDAATPGQQRLELVVSEPPVMAGIDGTSLPGDRAEWYSKTRGAFELRPARSGEGFDLFWVVYPLEPAGGAGDTGEAEVPATDTKSDPKVEGTAPPPLEPAVGSAYLAPASNEPAAALLISRNLAKCNFRLVRSGENGKLEPLTEARVATEDELPAYLELDIATQQGQTATWMFEVGWSVDPRTPLTARAAEQARRARDAAKPGAALGGGNSGTGRSGTGTGTGSRSSPSNDRAKPSRGSRGTGPTNDVTKPGGGEK